MIPPSNREKISACGKKYSATPENLPVPTVAAIMREFIAGNNIDDAGVKRTILDI